MPTARLIPDRFVDDGCSNWFDSLFGYDIRHACRRHDAAYCTRLHPPGSRTYAAKLEADRKLKEDCKEVLPWWLDWTAGAMWRAVLFAGSWGSWDSCGPEAGKLCRHNMPQPQWMLDLRVGGWAAYRQYS